MFTNFDDFYIGLLNCVNRDENGEVVGIDATQREALFNQVTENGKNIPAWMKQGHVALGGFMFIKSPTKVQLAPQAAPAAGTSYFSSLFSSSSSSQAATPSPEASDEYAMAYSEEIRKVFRNNEFRVIARKEPAQDGVVIRTIGGTGGLGVDAPVNANATALENLAKEAALKNAGFKMQGFDTLAVDATQLSVVSTAIDASFFNRLIPTEKYLSESTNTLLDPKVKAYFIELHKDKAVNREAVVKDLDKVKLAISYGFSCTRAEPIELTSTEQTIPGTGITTQTLAQKFSQAVIEPWAYIHERHMFYLQLARELNNPVLISEFLVVTTDNIIKKLAADIKANGIPKQLEGLSAETALSLLRESFEINFEKAGVSITDLNINTEDLNTKMRSKWALNEPKVQNLLAEIKAAKDANRYVHTALPGVPTSQNVKSSLKAQKENLSKQFIESRKAIKNIQCAKTAKACGKKVFISPNFEFLSDGAAKTVIGAQPYTALNTFLTKDNPQPGDYEKLFLCPISQQPMDAPVMYMYEGKAIVCDRKSAVKHWCVDLKNSTAPLIKEFNQLKTLIELRSEMAEITSKLKAESASSSSVSAVQATYDVNYFADTTPDYQTPLHKWLADTFGPVAKQMGGKVVLTKDQTGNVVKLKVTGPITFKYCVFSALRQDCLVDSNAVIDNIDTAVEIDLDKNKLEKLKEEHDFLMKVKGFLTSKGYDVTQGSKAADQFFSNNKDYQALSTATSPDDAAFKKSQGVSLVVAKSITAQGAAQVPMPLAALISTFEDELMLMLERYYADCQFKSFDGNSKTFVTPTRFAIYDKNNPANCKLNSEVVGVAPKKHESNIGIGLDPKKGGDQARQLWAYFERVDMAAQIKHVRFNAMQKEEDVSSALNTYWGNTLEDMKKLCDQNDTKAPAGNPCTDVQFAQKFEEHLIAKQFILGNAFDLFPNGNGNNSPYPKIHALLQKNLNLPLVSYLFSDSEVPNQDKYKNIPGMYSPLAKNAFSNTPVLPFKTNQIIEGGAKANLKNAQEFFVEHTSFKVMRNMMAHLAKLLYDPKTSEADIKAILEELGVTGSQLNKYKVEGTEIFNRYTIKLNLYPLIFASFIMHQIVVDPKPLSHANHPWVRDPFNKVPGTNKQQYVNTFTNWHTAILWQTDEAYSLNCGSSNTANTAVQAKANHKAAGNLVGVAGENDYDPAALRK